MIAEAAEWDVFISHASEDKDDFVRRLAHGLEEKGLKVWFDEFTLTVGDSLRRSIDDGLSRSRFGIVVISPAFLRKDWPQRELDGLVAREIRGVKVILPVWHNITADLIRKYSPTLADRLAVSSASGLGHVIAELLRAMGQGEGRTVEPKAEPTPPAEHTAISWTPSQLDQVVQVEKSQLTGEPRITLIKMYEARNDMPEPLLRVNAYVTPQLDSNVLPMVFYDPHRDVSRKTSILPGETFNLYYDFRPSTRDGQGLELQEYLNKIGGIMITLESDGKAVFQRDFSYSEIKQMLTAKQDAYLATRRLP
jgi:TIR domain